MTTETVEAPKQEQESEASLQAAFTQGFASARSEEPPAPPAEPAKTEETPPAAAGETPAGETPAAEPPPAEPDLASRVKQLESMLGDITHRYRSSEGRVGSLQRRLDELSKGQAAAPPPPESKPAVEKLKTEYPDLGPTVQAAIDEALDSAQGKQSQMLTQEQVREIVAQAIAPYEVEIHHKGWKQTVASPEFKFWMATAGKEAEALAASSASADAIKLLNMYVASAQKTAAPPPPPPPLDQSRRKLEAAQAVGTGARAESSPTALSDEAAFHSGFNSARQGR